MFKGEQSRKLEYSHGRWVLFFLVFTCQSLTYCTTQCCALLAAIHVTLERNDTNTPKLPEHSIRGSCWEVEVL